MGIVKMEQVPLGVDLRLGIIDSDFLLGFLKSIFTYSFYFLLLGNVPRLL